MDNSFTRRMNALLLPSVLVLILDAISIYVYVLVGSESATGVSFLSPLSLGLFLIHVAGLGVFLGSISLFFNQWNLFLLGGREASGLLQKYWKEFTVVSVLLVLLIFIGEYVFLLLMGELPTLGSQGRFSSLRRVVELLTRGENVIDVIVLPINLILSVIFLFPIAASIVGASRELGDRLAEWEYGWFTSVLSVVLQFVVFSVFVVMNVYVYSMS